MSKIQQQLEASLALVDNPVHVQRVDPTPMGVLQLAISQGADIDKLTKLMELQERWEANEARKAFVRAMADFKKEAIVITKDKDNKQYGSKYTSIGNLVNTATPILSRYGLSADWTLDQSKGIRVGCTATHSMGHKGETKWMEVPEDKSGAKNAIQQIKSSVTYARILTFEMAFGLASKEGSVDDDGNGSGENLDSDEFDRLSALLEGARTFDDAKKVFGEAYKATESLKDERSKKKFIELYEKKKKELR